MSAVRRNSNRARCQHEGCEKFAQTRGLCKAHGGGSRCRDPSCNKLAQSRGLCIAHGGGRRCQYEGCSKLAQSKGFCISHGGGRRCTVPDCEKFSQVKGRCKSHSKLAESSDHEREDGDDTESDRTIASPPNPRMLQAHPQHQQHYRNRSTPPSPPYGAHAETAPTHRMDFLANPLPRLQQRHAQDALPLPRSFGLLPSHQPLLPPRVLAHAAGNRENVHHQSVYNRTAHDNASQQSHGRHWEDSHKYESNSKSSSHPRSQSHSDEDLPPLPYTYTLPSAHPLFGAMEVKREADGPPQGYPLLPSRFTQSRPPMMTTTNALPTVSSIMAATATTVTSHAASTHDHFIGHRHAEPVAAMQPTSIPLLSFLDRSKEVMTSQSTQASWTSSSSMATASTSSAMSSIGSTASREGGTPPLPSIVLPPLKQTNQNPR